MKKRESNFELLRIVLMLLIIVGHLLLNSEKLGAIGTKEYSSHILGHSSGDSSSTKIISIFLYV